MIPSCIVFRSIIILIYSVLLIIDPFIFFIVLHIFPRVKRADWGDGKRAISHFFRFSELFSVSWTGMTLFFYFRYMKRKKAHRTEIGILRESESEKMRNRAFPVTSVSLLISAYLVARSSSAMKEKIWKDGVTIVLVERVRSRSQVKSSESKVQLERNKASLFKRGRKLFACIKNDKKVTAKRYLIFDSIYLFMFFCICFSILYSTYVITRRLLYCNHTKTQTSYHIIDHEVRFPN